MKKFFVNLWYYYKFHMLVALLLITATVIAVKSCAARKSYDVGVLLMTHGYDTGFRGTDGLAQKIGECVTDYNGDGVKNARIVAINYGKTANEVNSANAMRSANLAAGDSFLYLMDRQNYTELKAGGFLADLNELGGSGDFADAASCGILDYDGSFAIAGQDYFLCLRVYDAARAEKDEKYAARYKAAQETISNLIKNSAV